MMQLFQSPRTAVHLVTLLEEMPVQETTDAVAELHRLDLPVGNIIINATQQPLLRRGKLTRSEVRRGLVAAGLPAEREIVAGRYRGPLHGIPVGIKDIYLTQGKVTEGNSDLYRGFVPRFDATAVARLKDAGAVITGKAGTSELATAREELATLTSTLTAAREEHASALTELTAKLETSSAETEQLRTEHAAVGAERDQLATELATARAAQAQLEETLQHRLLTSREDAPGDRAR